MIEFSRDEATSELAGPTWRSAEKGARTSQERRLPWWLGLHV